MIAVVDTSAFVRLFIPDGPSPLELEELLAGVERGEDSVIAPQLLLAEAANVLNKKRQLGVLSAEECQELVGLFCRMPIRYYPHQELLPDALSLADEHELTVYDALFLALAARHQAHLITADEKLGSTAESMGL
jgi:predicted nucleic acid-binding protein